MDRLAARAAGPQEAAPQFKEEAFFEYHLYTLDRRTTVKDNQTKQMTLLQAIRCRSKSSLFFRDRPSIITTGMTREGKQKVGVFLELENTEKNHLGDAPAQRHGPGLQRGQGRKPSVHRRGSNRPHPEGRKIQDEDRRSLRCGRREGSDRLQEISPIFTRWALRSA